MKKSNWLFLIFLLLVSLQWIACNEEEDDNVAPISFTAQDIAGSYIITSFVDDGNEIASQFGNNGAIEFGSNKDVSFPGTANYGGWDFGDSDGEIDIEITVGNSPYSELEDDWVVVKLDDNELWLYDDDTFDDDEPDDDNDNEQVRLQRQN